MHFKKLPSKLQAPFKRQYGTKFRAGHHIYKFIWCTEIFDDNNQPACGLTSFQEKTVYIDINFAEVQETIVHEMYHAEAYESGMKQIQSFHHELEELCCEAASRLCKNFVLKKVK
jgi:hypothetical protein